jgi:predicted RNA-binding Zn-ribbon protein involved in translation (DUF1610 family)
MEELNSENIDVRFRQTGTMVQCPACGAMMSEVDRLKEGSHMFVWYECSKKSCGGQWLQKKPLFNMTKNIKVEA